MLLLLFKACLATLLLLLLLLSRSLSRLQAQTHIPAQPSLLGHPCRCMVPTLLWVSLTTMPLVMLQAVAVSLKAMADPPMAMADPQLCLQAAGQQLLRKGRNGCQAVVGLHMSCQGIHQ